MGIRWTGAAAQAAGALALAGTMWGWGGRAESASPPPSAVLAAAMATGDAPGTEAATGSIKAASTGKGAALDASGDHARRDMYGIINLAPPPIFRALINARSQVAFEYTGLDNSPHVGFFDGQRVIDVSPPGALASSLGALNDRAVLAAQTRPTIPDTFLPFRWTATGGLTFLPDPDPGADTFVNDINNRGQIVGFSQVVDRAVRWDAANRLVPLQLPAGFTQSLAGDINEFNITAGAATAADGNSHAVLWDAAGRLIDLGTFGAMSAVAGPINNRNEVAGATLNLDPAGNQNFRAFLWNRRDGIAFVTRPGPNTFIAALNERNEAVGRLLPPDFSRNRAFYFSRKRGFVDLHQAPFIESSAGDINDQGTIVGSMIRANPDGSQTELAFRWSNLVAVDLNTRLLNAPAGLVLTQALGISASGDIVANSNAGLLLLRLGGARADGPVLGPLTLNEPIRPNVATTLMQSFSDRNAHDTHAATVDWGDGSGPEPASVRENKGVGDVSATHTYASSGEFTIVVRVTDSAGKTTTTFRHVSVEPPRPFVGNGNGDRNTSRRELFGPQTPLALQTWVNRHRKK